MRASQGETNVSGDRMNRIRLRIGLAAGLAAGLSACGLVNDGTELQYGGMTFRGDVKASKADRAQFVATGGPIGASIDGATRAAAHQGTAYCIRMFGTSDIDWDIGPDTPQGQLPVSGKDVVFQGRCAE